MIIGAAISTALQGEEAIDRRLVSVAEDVAAALDPDRKESDRKVRLESLYWDAVEWLNAGRPAMQEDRRTFHWPLEFPEVFQRGGFHAIVGNPPFLGGTRISGPLGRDYRAFLAANIAGRKTDRADLATFFLLRASQVIRPSGNIGLITTNSIAQGDSREVGLERLAASDSSIYRAVRTRGWPGNSAVQVAQIWLHDGKWSGQIFLAGEVVGAIAPNLEPASRSQWAAKRLAANRSRAFEGSKLLGIGFVISENEAQELLERDSRNTRVVRPYLSGDDLNNSPTQSPSRWVINFYDWSLEEAAAYPECLALIRERVKPQRDLLRDDKRREKAAWWQFERRAVDLYQSIDELDHVIAVATVSKHLGLCRVPSHFTFAHYVVVFAYDTYEKFGLLSSGIHRSWVLRQSTSFETRPTYHPSDCFETFPQPERTDGITEVAKALDEHRGLLMLERNEGLTKTYNRVHNPEETSADIARLRRLHVEVDDAVAAANGWNDLDLDHGFHETPQGIRYTFGPVARVEVLDRLLELNQKRYAEEVAAGLHDKTKAAKRKRSRVAVADQQTLEGIP